jgi:hypothetical protein
MSCLWVPSPYPKGRGIYMVTRDNLSKYMFALIYLLHPKYMLYNSVNRNCYNPSITTHPAMYPHQDNSRDGNGDFPVGEWLFIPVPAGRKIPRPHPRKRSRENFFSHSRPRRRIYPRGEPAGNLSPLEV